MSLTRIDYVWIETVPWGQVGEEPVLDDEYTDLPEQFLSALSALYHRPDYVSCWGCGRTVGFVLDDEPPGTLEWRTTTLAREDEGPVAVLCEHCDPRIPESPVTVSVLRRGR